MNASILKAFDNLGFELKDQGEYAYLFDYENIHFLLMKDNDDEFLSICIPGYCDTDDISLEQMSKVAEHVNASLKYVKTYFMGNNLWLYYERELFGKESVEDFEQVIERMVLRLAAALQTAREKIHEIKKENEGNDESDDNND